MTLHHIEVFCAVCKEGSMSKAALKLNMTQPGVSRIISDLELYYQTVLFIRKGRTLELTAAGKQYYKDSLLVLQDFKIQENNIRHSQEKRNIVLGCTTGLGLYVMNQIVEKFNKRFPSCTVYVTDNSSRVICDKVTSGSISIGLVQNITRDEALKAEPLIEDELVAVCKPDYPIRKDHRYSVKDLSKENLLLMESGRTTRNIIDKFFMDKGMVAEPSWTSASVSTLKELAMRGKGIAVLFEVMVRNDLEEGTLIKVPVAFSAKKEFYLTYRKDSWLSEEENYILTLCRESAREWKDSSDNQTAWEE
ncbi:MAG: LysR family transcriptional regulator [Candidatus Ornithospirochaeta sp.]